MSQARILGGRFYNNPQFKALMNSLYYPLDNMKKSVEKLKNASDQIDIETFSLFTGIISKMDMSPSWRDRHARSLIRKQCSANWQRPNRGRHSIGSRPRNFFIPNQ